MFSSKTRRSLLPAAAMVATTGLTGPTTTADAADGTGPTGTPERQTLSESTFETRLFLRTNARRKAVNCPPLRVNAALARAARLHTLRMANRRELAHQLSGEPALGRRITNAGYRSWSLVAENIAWSSAVSPDRVFDTWIRSTGHRRNIQNCRFKEIGIGVEYADGQVWATQNFGRR